MGTFILIAGAWHGAWCWHKVLPLLRDAGHTAVALDLPATGRDRAPLGDVSLQSYVDRVSAAMDEQPGRVILVGHGRGGIVISQAAEQRPARIEKLIYLAAFLLPAGQAVLPAALHDRASLLVPRVVVDIAQGCITIGGDGWRQALYGDCSDEDVELAAALLMPEALAPCATPLELSERNYGRVPRSYIETSCDAALTLNAQRMMVAAQPCASVITMKTGHAPFFSAPHALAEALAAA